MNEYIVKNNMKNNFLINDLPEIPVIGPGETHNLLGCTTLERIKGSEQLKYCIKKGWISVVKNVVKVEEKEQIEEAETPDLTSKIDSLEKSVFTIVKTTEGLKDAIKMLEERFNTPTPPVHCDNEIAEENDRCKLDLLREERTDLISEIEHIQSTLEEKFERMNQIDKIL